jgi:hypothetical protein
MLPDEMRNSNGVAAVGGAGAAVWADALDATATTARAETIPAME